MFTIEQVKAAHARVKSGADFPAYVQDLTQLGVKSYTIFVADGHADYFSESGYQTSSAATYDALPVAGRSNAEDFKHKLKIHQQGQTDYMTFCRDAADTGVEKWTVDLIEMLCIYYDKAGNVMVVETIPEV